jgi:hypothetical protein
MLWMWRIDPALQRRCEAAGDDEAVRAPAVPATPHGFASANICPPMDAIRLDHIVSACPARKMEELFEEKLAGGCRRRRRASRWFRQEFAGGGRIEVIYPTGPPAPSCTAFSRTARVHHVTLKVPSPARCWPAPTRAAGADRRGPPQSALAGGVPAPRAGRRASWCRWSSRSGGAGRRRPASGRPRATRRALSNCVVGEVGEAARRQWASCSAPRAHPGRLTHLPLTGVTHRARGRRPSRCRRGPAGELRAPRDLELPGEAYPGLGARFVQIR